MATQRSELPGAPQALGVGQHGDFSPFASPGRRLGAFAIDLAIVSAIAWTLVLTVWPPSAFALVIALLQVLYFAGFEGTRLRGSPGKLLLGLQVLATSGRPLSFRRALARNIAKLPTVTLSFFFCLIRGRPTWYDALASTVVVHRDREYAASEISTPTSRARRLTGWTIVGAAFAGVIVYGLFHTFTTTIIVEGSAMTPTFADQRQLTVETFSYLFSSPERGDVITLNAVSAGYPHKYLIDRIVGLPGDTVQVRNSGVFINGRELSEPYLAQPARYQWGPETVPHGQYFVLGDNRNDSFDSHDWPISPWVARGDIIGKVWN